MGANRFVLGMMGAVLLALAGCSTYAVDEGVQPGVRVVTPETQAQLNRVGYLTDGLGGRVAVEQTGAERTPTNTLKVWATFRNRTDYPQKIAVRTQYYNEGRRPNSGPGKWQHVYLQPNAIETYETHSETTDADYYYIEVRDLR